MTNLPSALILILVGLGINASAQNQLEHTKKYFVNEEGRLFWQAEKPVFLFISENADGSESKRLESEAVPEFTNPLYLDTEGINYVRTKWAVDPTTKKSVSPQQEIVFEVYRDGTAPATTVEFGAPNKYQSSDVLYYGQELTTSATAKDGLVGVDDIYYSLNQAAYTNFTEQLTYPTDGEYVLKFYSVDKVGNTENPQIFAFTVDLTQPATKYSVLGDKTKEILSPRTTIKLEGSDGSSGVEGVYYKIDDAEPRRFNNSIALTNVEEGEHTLTYYSVDRVNNKEDNKTYDFYLDRTAPVVVASVVGDQYQNRGRVFISTRTKVKLAATDNKAGLNKIWFKIDDGQETPYTEPFELPRTPGKHIIEYFASDKVNNDFRSLFDESASGRESLDIDIEAPTIDFNYAGTQYFSRDTAFITSNTDIALSATDDDSGVKAIGYKINNGQGQVYASPIRLPEEGTYTIDFYGTDQVNNRNSKAFFFVVDNTGPKIEQILSMEAVGSITLNDREDALEVYSKGIKLYLAATDDVVDTEAIYYTVNDGPERRYDAPVVLNTLGIASYKIRAVDKLGNQTETETFEVFLK